MPTKQTLTTLTHQTLTHVLILILSIAVLGTVIAITSQIANRGKHNEPVKVVPTCSTCDGTPTSKCEQECMMEASTKPIEYFDDEELDAFKGRPADAYTDDEVEQFADVLYTMRQDEVAEWCRSLTLRGINLPNQLKDETLILIDN